MEKIMTYENLRRFAYVNDGVCEKPVRGIVISFFGLGGMEMYPEDTYEGRFYGERGILYVVPYNNPWAWMNRQAVSYTDEVLDVLMAEYGLGGDIPIVSTGGSMGGQSALVYMVYAKRTPVACVVNCPVCDVVYHYTEREDLPRTLYSAVAHEEGGLEEALRAISPLHLAEKMPDAVYHIFHCEEDEAVNKKLHSDLFVETMRQRGHVVSYDAVPGRGHCDLTEPMRELYKEYILDAVRR